MKFLLYIFLSSCSVYAQFPKVLVGKQREAKGLAIAIHPLSSNTVLAAGSAGQVFQSSDGGRSWSKALTTCPAFVPYGNPQLAWDTAGKAFYSDLAYPDPQVITDGSWLDRILINRSDSAAGIFKNCEFLAKTSHQIPFRHFLHCNPESNDLHLTWTSMSAFKKNSSKDSSKIMYSRSVNAGSSWSEPIAVTSYKGDCKVEDSTMMGAVSCSGTKNKLFVCWADAKGIWFRKFENGWKEAKNLAPLRGGWAGLLHDNLRINGLPSICCDRSRSAHKDRIYICWSDERNGAENEDVFYMYSDDHGETWIDPVILTYENNHRPQFMPVMKIDQTNGDLYFLYYSQQNYFDKSHADLYLACSKNGAQKFEYYKVNDHPLEVGKNQEPGDNIALDVQRNLIRPLWSEYTGKNEMEIYTAIIDLQELKNYTVAAKIKTGGSVKFSEKMLLPFTMNETGRISACIYKPLDPEFKKVFFTDKKFKTGNNKILINTRDLTLEKGTYVVTLYLNGTAYPVWITAE